MSLNRKVKFNQMCCICYCTGTSLYNLELSTHQEQPLAEIAETILRDKLVTGLNFNLPKYSCMRCIKGIIESKLLQQQLHKTNVLFQLLLNNGTLDSNHDTQYVTVEKSDIWETCVEPSCELVWVRGTYKTYARKKLQKEIKIKSEPPEKCLQISDDFNTEEDSITITKHEIAKIEDDVEECIYESNIECNSPDNTEFDLMSDKKSEVVQECVTVLQKSPENNVVLLKSPENDVVLQKSQEQDASLQEFEKKVSEGCILKINVNTDSDLELELDSDINELEEFELCPKRKKKNKSKRKTYMCTETGCGNETFGYADFRDHNRRLHPQVFTCSQCDKRYYSRTALSNHRLSHRYVTCEVCKKRLKKNSLSFHMKSHAGGERPLNKRPQNTRKLFCQKCGSFFSQLNKHTSCFGKPNTIVEKKFKCDFCDFKTPSNGCLLRHRKRHTGEKPFLCNSCGYSCIQQVTLVAHQKLHRKLDRPLICYYLDCEMSFTDRYEYRLHRRKHLPIYSGCGDKILPHHKYRYPNKITVTCKICGKGFTSQAAVEVHMRCHTNERPFKCTHCSNTFRQSHHLRSHLSLIHNNDDTANRYPCKICDKVLRSALTLRDHIRIHTGDKLPCKHCDKKFTHTSNLMKHIREVHGIRIRKIYKN